MKIRQVLEARYHSQPDLEDPEGWVFSVTDAVDYNDYAADFWASQDLGNTVWEMENNPSNATRTNLRDGIRAVHDYGLHHLNAALQETEDRDTREELEYNYDRLFEKYSEIFIEGVMGGKYHFFLVKETDSQWDTYTLVALK